MSRPGQRLEGCGEHRGRNATVSIAATIPAEWEDRLKEQAGKNRASVAAIVRELIRAYLYPSPESSPD